MIYNGVWNVYWNNFLGIILEFKVGVISVGELLNCWDGWIPELSGAKLLKAAAVEELQDCWEGWIPEMSGARLFKAAAVEELLEAPRFSSINTNPLLLDTELGTPELGKGRLQLPLSTFQHSKVGF